MKYIAHVQPVAFCQGCGVQLTREEADTHRSECHAFVGQVREECCCEPGVSRACKACSKRAALQEQRDRENAKRISELESQIAHHEAVYRAGRPEISDDAFDVLVDELADLVFSEGR